MMELKLLPEDIKPKHRGARNLRMVRFDHLTAKAQQALLATGRATLWRGGLYEAIAPKQG